MNVEQLREVVAENSRCTEGARVRVYWGYGLGFRVDGVGTITKVFAKSVRVKLEEDVPSPYGGKPWPAGFELQGIPRFGNQNWRHRENGVEVLS